MYYGPDIMQKSGIQVFDSYSKKENALFLNIPLAGFNALGSFVSIFIIDKLGRRYIMLRSLPFIAASWLLVATGMGLTGLKNPGWVNFGGKLAIVGICSFLLSFSTGMSSTPWAVNAEIYPLHVIGMANSLSTTTNWVTNAIVAQIFLSTTDTVTGEILTYSGLALVAMIAFTFIYFLVPETANKEIDQIL